MANQEIFELITKNLAGLNSIEKLIDKDIKNEILKFNLKYNNELRNLVFIEQYGYMPFRENKFCNLIDEFVKNQESIFQNKESLSGK